MGRSHTFVECPLPLIGVLFTLVSAPLASVGDRLTVIGGLFSLLKQSLPLLQQASALLVSELCRLVSFALITPWLLLALHVPTPYCTGPPATENTHILD